VSLRLFLLRHARAAASAPGAADRARPLVESGRRDAIRMGQRLAAEVPMADLILCSDAERARQTMDLVVAAWGRAPECRIVPELYEQIGDDYVDLLRARATGASSVMVVAHNPAIHATALALVDPEQAEAGAMRRHFPTAALAVLDVDGPDWPSLPLGSARLAAFLTPGE
jgi:phosphohistidine phosphatase